MSKFSEALERQRQRFSQGDGDDLYSQLMARARNTNVYDTNIPEIDTRGVEPYDDEWEDSWGKRLARGLTGLEDIIGLSLKGIGATAKGRSERETNDFNELIQGIYEQAGRKDEAPKMEPYNAGGELASALGDYIYKRGHSAEREKAFNPNNRWRGTDLVDIISQGNLGEYLTDTDSGALYELPYGIGNALGFIAPAKALPSGMADAATSAAIKILNPVSGLLGKAGANRAADIIGSKAAKELLGTSMEFGATMGPYGAMVNAGTIVDELKKQGKSDAEIADAISGLFAEELPADIAFGALTGNVMKGNLGKVIAPRNSSLGRKIAAQLPAIPLESAGGYLSNVNQMILSEKYSGKPYGELFGEHTDAEKEAGRLGAVAGLPFSVLGGYHGVRNAQVADQRYAAEQAYSDAREQAYGRQNIAQQALRDARQELGEGAKDSQVLVRANELFNQRVNEQAGARQIDLSGEDEATQKIFDRFAQERAQAAVDNNDADAASFWNGMFSGNTFNNTTENRAAIRQRYGTELNRFAQTYDPATGQPTQTQPIQTSTPQPQQQGQTQQGQTQQQQTQPQQQQPTAKSTSNKYLRGNDNVMQEGNKFLEELRAKGTQADMETTVRLQAAIRSGDEPTVRNILEANNRPIAVEQQTAQTQPQQQQQAQQQTDPVKQNQPPENIIQQESTQPQQQAQPKKQPKTPEGKAQSTLAKPLQSKKGETRRKAGNAVIFLADKNGIEISDADRKSLGNGKTAVVNKWRDILISKGILSPQATQSPPKQSPPAQPQTQQQTQPQAQETTQPQEAAQPTEQPLTLQERMQQIVNEAIQERNEKGQQEYTSRKEHILLQNRQDADEAEAAKEAKESQERFAQARQYHNDQQNDANFEAELPTLRQAQYWLYDNGNEQAAREMEDAISERSLYKAHLIADRTNVPQEILPRVPQRSEAGRRATPAQNSSTGFDALVTKARQYQNILMEDGDTQGAQAIEDAIQNRDEAALRDLPTTREEISAREEQARREKQDQEVEAKRKRQEDDAINAALSTPSVDEFSRKKQGAGILKLMNSQSFKDTYGTIELLPGLERALQNGRRKGIEAAQDLLREHGVTERTENPEAAKERGQQQRDAYYEDELDAALEEPSKDKSERQEQGKAILKLLDSSFFKNAKEKVSRLAGLQKSLREGNTKAIRKAQEIIRDAISGNQKQRNTRGDIQARRDARKERQNKNREARREARAEQAEFEDELDAESEMLDSRIDEEEARDERVARHEEEEERDAESERLEARMDDAEALEELFGEEEEPPTPPEKEPPAKPEEEQKQQEPTAKEKAEPLATKEKVTPQDLAKELDQIEDRAKAEGDKDPRPTAPYVLSHFAQVTKDALAKILPLNKFPHVFADYIERIDDTLVEGLHKFGKDATSCIRSIENLRKVCEDVFNDAYNAVRHEDALLRKEGEIDRKTPNVKNSPSEKISEAEVLSDEQSAAKEPSKEVRNLADKIKKLLIERLGLNKALAERLSTTVDGLATRNGDNVARFKAECRNLIAEANSGQLKTRLEADEAAYQKARYGGKRSSSSSKKDPQAAEKAKTRADKLKADIETLLPQLDKYPNLKADIFKIIDRGVDFAGKSGQSSKFSGWASRYLGSLEDLVKEKSKTKEGIEGWLEQQERQLSRQKEPTDVSPKETKPTEAKTEEKPKPETKSMEGEADTRIINVIEDESTLTPLQKLLKSFSEKLGVPLKFFRNPDGKFHGSFSNGVLFLNVNSKKGLGGVFWHEAFHWLKANNPKLYAKLVDAAGITDKDRQAFLERTKRKDLKTNEEIDEEILADQMDDVAKRTGLLQTIAGKNRGVVERVVQWLKDTMNKFIETFRNPTGGLTTKQAQALANEFGRIARQLKDENGEQIFRVNNRTGDIEVVEGRKARELSSEEIESAAKSPNVKYSVDPNDNSSESWGQRVANFARAVIGLRKPAPERIHQKMKRQLSELSDLKIAAGHLPEGVQEKIDEVAKVIRTGKEYDWVKVLPSVGNAVAAQLGITQSAEMGNYIGKFLYGESAPDTSAEAQEFKEAMRKNEDMRDKILACRDTFSQWRNMSTEEQMIASMRFEEEQKPFRTRAQNFWKSFKTQFVESLTPVQSAVDAFEKRTGMKLDDVINPMSAFRLLRGVGGRAQRMIVGGEKTRKALQAALPNLNLDNWKPIRMILEPIGAFENQKKREAFSAYVTACHMMDIHRQNNNNLKKQAETQSKIDALKDELKLAGNKKERARIEKSIERQEETLDSLKRNIKDIAEAWDTEEKCQTVINKHKDEFGAAQKELVDYSNSLLAMRVDAGLMTLERFNELLNIYPNYVPLHRVIDEVSGGDKADSMEHMVGSAKDIYDPIHAIMSNTFDTVRRCEKNKAKCLLATIARFDGVGQIFEEVENGNGDGTTITFYENGKMKHLQCSDETLVKAVNNLTPASMNWFIRALRIPTVILKGTATVLNVNFGARNVLRDSQDAYVYGAKHGGNVFKDIAKFMTPYAALKGAYDAFQMNDVFEEFMVNGGAQSTFLTFDANYEQDAFDTLIKGKYKRFASAKGVLKLLETLGSYSELGTRLGRFEQVKGNLKEKHGGINIYGDLVSAALESRDLMDFARSGEAGRTMNAVSAFANPAIQGWDKFFRTFDYKKLKRFGGTDETQRQWMTSAARLVLDSVVPALLLTLLHHDDDWYKKDVQDWEKETHWILSDTIRIPKPADVGARFLSNFTEKMMDWSLNNEPATFKKVFAPLWASLPDLLPTALQPVIECIANYDMFRRSPIVPRRESKLSPEMQYDSQSSNLAKFIGEKAGVSPRYIDHFIYGFTSNFGKGITRGMDTVAYKAGLSDRPPAFTRDWIPIIGGFLRVPYRNPKIVQDYYEALDKQESLLNDYKKHRKSDRNAKPSEEYDRALHARLKGAQNAMQALAAQERKVIEDQRLSSEEVDKRQREIQKRRVALCERVLGKAR